MFLRLKTGELKGQSLLEILVALSFGVIILGSSLNFLALTLKSYSSLDFLSNAYTLLKEYGEMLSYSAKNYWNSLIILEREIPYKINFQGITWNFTQGSEESGFKEFKYRLYFKVFDVYRDLNGNISEFGYLDPSTLKIIVYLDYGINYEKTLSLPFFVTRSFLTFTFTQTDWSGGSGYPGPYLESTNVYDSSENIEVFGESEESYITLATTTSSGFLISSIFDTNLENGSNFHSLIWDGTLCENCQVKIQLASSNSQNGPWNYYGPTSQSDYYAPLPNQLVALPYNGSSSHQNKRYIRYKIELVPYNNQSPSIDNISINFAK